MERRFSADETINSKTNLSHKSSIKKEEKKTKARNAALRGTTRKGSGRKHRGAAEIVPEVVPCGWVAGGDRVGREISPTGGGRRGRHFDTKRWNSGLLLFTYVRSGPPCQWCLAPTPQWRIYERGKVEREKVLCFQA
jgi:hypothetical protein